jgi:outer membrane protein assembly factor BamB
MAITFQAGLAAALILSFQWAGAARADDWPEWRGQNRDGAWNEIGISPSFPTGGLKIRWHVPVGPGFSSPVVAQGRVYLTDVHLTRPKAQERVLCFEATTGQDLWAYSYDVDYPDWAFDPKNPAGPRATPIVRDGKLYTWGALGHLVCFEAGKGEVLWKKGLDREYQVKEFASTASPLIEGGLLILFVGGKPDACVVAFDTSSGKEVWRALDESPTFSSPIVVTRGGNRQLIVWTNESVTSLDPATGKVYWRERLGTQADYAVSTPVFHEGLLLLSGLMLKLDPDRPSASILWPDTRATSRRILSNTSTPMFRGDYLFSARSSGELVCIEAKTGKLVWETDKVTDTRSGASIHLTPNGESVFLFNDHGDLIRAQLTAQGYKELGRASLLKPTYPFGGKKVAWPPPAYANGHVFARSDEELVCAVLTEKP